MAEYVERVADLLDALGRTSDAMVAVDGSLNIVGWNDAATNLLGYSEDEVTSLTCHQALGWKDRAGNPVCGPDCPSCEPGAPDEVIATREVLGRTADGKKVWLNVTSVVPPVEMRDECRVVHLIREVALPPELERLIAERLAPPPPEVDEHVRQKLESLTPRESEILDLLTQGLDGNAIAEKLYLSKATVRNHLQHILGKLDVHSRVEAVAFALRNQL